MTALNNGERSTIYKVELDERRKNDARIIASGFIVPGTTVLDVGCACGDFGAYIFHHLNCQVTGMEFDEGSISAAKNTKAYNTIYQIDLNNFHPDTYSSIKGRFHYVTLLDVLEHLDNPLESLVKLKEYIKEEDGEFLISVPNVAFGDIKESLLLDDFSYTETGILDRTHLRFFTYKTFAVFLANAGLGVVECKPKVSPISWSHNPSIFIRIYIALNPHSHVYQYVMRVKPFNIDQSTLCKLNLKKLEMRWSDIKLSHAGMSRWIIFLRAMLGKWQGPVARIVRKFSTGFAHE